MKVSIITPFFNSEKYIRQTIESVLSQTFSDWEMILIDDGSEDSSLDIINEYSSRDDRFVVIENGSNQGVAISRNNGIKAVRGEYIAFLDSDDIWRENKLEKQISLAEKTGADIVYCSYGMIDGDSRKSFDDFIVPERTDFEMMLIKSVISCSTALIKAEIMKNHLFQTNYFHEDYAMWLQLLEEGYYAVGCTEVLADYRVAASSKSINKIKSALQRWHVYRKYLKLSLHKSLSVFIKYGILGLKKYKRRSDE